MSVKYSPATLGGLNFSIEENAYPGGTTRVSVQVRGPHQLAAAGLRAILSRFNTYYGTTLTAAQVSTIVTNVPFPLISLGTAGASFGVLTTDVATLTAGIATDLQGASAVVFG